MTIPPELESRILRYYHAEQWRVGTIATQLEAYLRLRSLPGEQAQVDWGHFGHLEIGRARRPLMAFVMVLSYSRRIVLRFFPDARRENFLRGHMAAFQALGGVARGNEKGRVERAIR